MALFRMESDGLLPIPPTDFAAERIMERHDLQRRLRDRPDAIEPGLFIVAEEYGEWEESRRRIDLLGLDSDGNVVIVELKRTDQDVFMDLQAVRYASLVSALGVEDLVRAHAHYLSRRGIAEDARVRLLSFLGWESEDDVQIGPSPRIVLVAPAFSKELTTCVLWLNDHSIDVKCVQVTPHRMADDILLDITQVIPLPQASDYQVGIRRKVEAAIVAQQRGRRERTAQILVRAGKIKPGDVITLLPSAIGKDSLDTSNPIYRARFADDISRQKNVIWEKDQALYALSTLCEHMRDILGVPFAKGGLNGYACWALEGSSELLWHLAERARSQAET